MKTMIKKLVLFPLLATLATAPLCAKAQAHPWFTLGLGWGIVPVVVGGVVLYQVGKAQGEGSAHGTVYVPAEPAADTRGGYTPTRTVEVLPAPTPIYAEPAGYYQTQYGYVLRTPQ